MTPDTSRLGPLDTPGLRAVVLAARERRWSAEVEPGTGFAARLTPQGRPPTLVIGGAFGLNSDAASRVARDKAFARHFLTRSGVGVVPHTVVRTPYEARAAASALGPTVAIKPNRGAGGAGVSRVEAQIGVNDAFARARTHDELVLVERWDERDELRVYVLGGTAEAVFAKRPAAGSDVANLSAGGRWRDATASAPPGAVRAAETSAAALGLGWAAVDLFAAPGAQAAEDTAVLEVNASPGLRAVERLRPGLLRAFADAVLEAATRRRAPAVGTIAPR